jgi:SAM-dependent methyltransferase
MTDEQPHSAQFLTDARDHWWNEDFLRLLAARTGLDRARRVVDVGAGQGHWTRTIARLLPRGASVIGVEREPAWVEKASAFPAVDGVAIEHRVGSAERLPLEDGAVDVVTCQTLLIHVADPRAVLREMHRVLAPGGLLLACEPNNLSSFLGPHVATPDYDVEDLVAAFRLEAVCEKGKHALGLGYNSLGEGLVGLLADAEWTAIRAWACDKTRIARAPYDGDAKRALDDDRRWHEQGAFGWPIDETRRYWDAGGGDGASFADVFARARRVAAKRLAEVDAGTYAGLDGSLLYVIAATKR